MTDLVLAWDLGTGGLLLLAAASVALLLVLIMALKVHAFLALMLTSILTAIAAGIPFERLVEALGFGFNSTLGTVMLLVALGAMLGRMIEASGGAKVLSDAMIARFGEHRAGLALSVASLLMGFPIFFDAGLVVMMPIIYAVARRVGGSFLSIAFPAAIAFSAMHIFVPPHPGPVSASAIYGADVGLVLILGLVVALPIWYVAGVVVGSRIGNRFDIPVPTILDATAGDDDADAFRSSPSVGRIVGLLLLPLVLILLNTGLNMAASFQPDPDAFLAQPLVAVLRSLGETPIALLITVFVSMGVLGWGMGKPGSLVERLADSALGPICSVVLVTGAGGMFGGVLRATGIGDAVAESMGAIGLPAIVAAFLVSLIVRIAQGSATVALTTAASLMTGVVAAGDYTPVQIAAIVLATAAGSVGFSHVNDSGFWLVSRFFGMDMKQTLSTWTLLQGLMAVLGFGLSLAIYAVGGLVG
ncbi:GntP family permease [Agrococcus jejuensis]|uniref:Gluconate:H+ symporter, GntP family n=1 Tax=Agrococcus jejuensis TaxID=399736 RepID=A0A1G8FNC2_9MICO|nr:GntP family permease [Agrococcus jejuensis]SDH83581.1 gluconate:H+ symporter, GntP family [Agrococcus jejuensis]